MKVQERLGRRKEEARAGLEAARGKHPAPPAVDAAAVAEFVKGVAETQCVLAGSGADALAAAAVVGILGKREGGRDVRVLHSKLPDALHGFDHARMIENAPSPLWLTAAALLGHDLHPPREDEFALRLGALIQGIGQKPTLLPSPRMKPIGAFVQRLLEGVPVILGEPAGRKSDYGVDRLFVSIALEGEAHDMSFLAEAGHPVLQWKLESPDEIGAEIVRWQIAAQLIEGSPAPAGPGAPMPAEPSLRSKGLALFAEPVHAQVLRKAAGTLGAAAAASAPGWIAAHLALADPGDHVVLACWLPEDTPLADLQREIRTTTKLACTSMFEHVRARADASVLLLTRDGDEPGVRAAFESVPAGRALRVHTEDGDPAKIIEALREAAKMLSRT